MKFKLNKLELKWVLYDVGNSAFTLLISTIMPIYFNFPRGKCRYFRRRLFGLLGICHLHFNDHRCGFRAYPWNCLGSERLEKENIYGLPCFLAPWAAYFWALCHHGCGFCFYL